jgi:hypothetical protein
VGKSESLGGNVKLVAFPLYVYENYIYIAITKKTHFSCVSPNQINAINFVYVSFEKKHRDLNTWIHKSSPRIAKLNSKSFPTPPPNDFVESLAVGTQCDVQDKSGSWFNGTILDCKSHVVMQTLSCRK